MKQGKRTNEILTEELLRTEYEEKQKGIKQIAEEQGVAVGSVYNYLKRFGIERRPSWTKEKMEKLRIFNKTQRVYPRGKKHSEETKRKISESRKWKWLKPTEYGGHTKHRNDGYIQVYRPDHPNANSEGYVMEHHLVMEAHIGRYIREDEVVHHINHDRQDNRIENLQLMTIKEHAALHLAERNKKTERRNDLLTACN